MSETTGSSQEHEPRPVERLLDAARQVAQEHGTEVTKPDGTKRWFIRLPNSYYPDVFTDRDNLPEHLSVNYYGDDRQTLVKISFGQTVNWRVPEGYPQNLGISRNEQGGLEVGGADGYRGAYSLDEDSSVTIDMADTLNRALLDLQDGTTHNLYPEQTVTLN